MKPSSEMGARDNSSAGPGAKRPPLPRLSRLPDLAYLGIGAVLFLEVLLHGARFIDRDLLHIWYPVGQSIAEAWQGSGSFLWDSNIGHGVPLLARWSPSVLYPSHWLFALLPVEIAIAVGVFFHFTLAASSTRWLVRRYTANPIAAWIAGLSYASSGYLLSVIGCGPYFFGAALLPLSLLALHRLAEKPDLARLLQLSLVMMLQLFVPDPQTLYYEFLVLSPLVLLVHAHGPGRRKMVVALGLSGVLAVGLGFCQLWPTIELSALSVRAAGIAPSSATSWSLHPLRLLEYVVPGFFGNSMTGTSFWAPFLVNNHIDRPWAASIHLGLLPLLGLLHLSWKKDRKVIIAWGGVTLLFFVLALGERTPVFSLLRAVPGANNFRYPEKYMLFVTLGLILLGSIGLGRMFDRMARGVRKIAGPCPKGAGPSRPPRTSERKTMVALAALTGLLVGFRLLAGGEGGWLAGLIVSLRAPVSTQVALEDANFALMRCAAVAAALLVVLLLRRRMNPRLVITILLAVSIIDVVTAGLPLRMLGGSVWIREQPKLCQALPPARRGLKPLIWHDVRMVYRGDPPGTPGPASPGERNRRWQKNILKRNIGTAYCVRYAVGMEEWLLNHQQLTLALLKHPDHLVDLYGVQFIVEKIGLLPRRYPVKALFGDLGVGIYKNDGLPFGYGRPSVIAVPDNAAAIRRVAEPTFPLRRTAVFESDSALPSYPAAKREVHLQRYRPGRIELQANFDAPGYMVVLESHYPGWRARLDGQQTTIWRANAAFIGLKIPAGSHRVTLAFEPARQRLANGVSLGALLLTALALCGVFVVRLRRKTTAGPS